MPMAKGAKMTKLWQTSTGPNPLVEQYTVGNDHLIDLKLLEYDLRASEAHTKMLAKLGVLDKNELKDILAGLNEIKKLHKAGKFEILAAQEDMHTAIEQYLTENYGEAGKKIHTGRSRNDQVLTALRLYMKDKLALTEKTLQLVSDEFNKAAKKYPGIPMPGYTHMQKAMPTSVSKWLKSYADAAADLQILIKANQELIDQNPLGSASGFGIGNFSADREFTAAELSFAKVQNNEIYCANSRGFFELACLQNMHLVTIICSRFASDMLLFTTREFSYFSLPDELTTGSSIMPNKRNYDVFEIMRGSTSLQNGYVQQVQGIISSLGSGFQRDLQLTKEPFIKGVELTLSTLEVLAVILPELQANEDNLKQVMTSELFATEEVYKLVSEGMPFRDAYKKIKSQYDSRQ